MTTTVSAAASRPAPYDHEALWTKAKLFLNRALDSDEKTFDERALWAALALELLAKAALAKVSPLLIAIPKEDGVNLLVASGLVQGDIRFNSLPAHSLFARCQRAFKPFSEKHATAISEARNEYLHGAGVGFTPLPPEAWWPRYWSQAVIVVNALDQTLDGLVGPDRVAEVERHLAQNTKNIEHRVEMLIGRAKQRLAMQQSGDVPARLAKEWASAGTNLTAGLQYSAAAVCPACGELGVLEGEQVDNSELKHEQVSEDDWDTWVDLSVSADYFSCPECHLVLDGWELLEQANLDTSFTAEGDVEDYIGDDYGND